MVEYAISANTAWKKPRIGAKQVQLLEKLSNACGVTGEEGAIRKLILQEIRPLVDDLRIDHVGNILATKQGKGKNLPRVMLAAHMDEIGFMLTHDEGKGIFRFALIGDIDPRQLPGKQVWVGKEKFPGVIGMNPIHLSPADEQSAIPNLNSLRIDLGPVNAENVKTGDRATFATNFMQVGESFRGKALDNRLGIVSLITILKNAPENIDLLAAFTVMEEVTARGAIVAGYTMNPDLAIAIDCTPALDLPVWDGSENTQYRSKQNKGAVIYNQHRDMLSDPRLIIYLKAVGDAYKIPYQLRQPGGGRTDASSIHRQRAGIPSITISVPGRYLHTAASIVKLKDWQNTLALTHAALSHIDSEILKDPR